MYKNKEPIREVLCMWICRCHGYYLVRSKQTPGIITTKENRWNRQDSACLLLAFSVPPILHSLVVLWACSIHLLVRCSTVIFVAPGTCQRLTGIWGSNEKNICWWRFQVIDNRQGQVFCFFSERVYRKWNSRAVTLNNHWFASRLRPTR